MAVTFDLMGRFCVWMCNFEQKKSNVTKWQVTNTDNKNQW